MDIVSVYKDFGTTVVSDFKFYNRGVGGSGGACRGWGERQEPRGNHERSDGMVDWNKKGLRGGKKRPGRGRGGGALRRYFQNTPSKQIPP